MPYSTSGRTYGCQRIYTGEYGADLYSYRDEEGIPLTPLLDAWIDNFGVDIITNDPDVIVFKS